MATSERGSDPLRADDITIPARPVASAEEKDEGRAPASEYTRCPGAVIDPKLADAVARRPDVSTIADRDTIAPISDALASPGVPKASYPHQELARRADLDHTRLVLRLDVLRHSRAN